MDWTEAKPSKLLCKALTPWCILHVQLGMVTVIWTHEVITPGNSGLFCCACFPWSISNHAGTCLAHAGVCLEAVYTAQLGALPAPAGLAGLAAPQHLPQGSLCCWSCVSCLGSAPELAAGLCSCRLWSCCSASQQDRLIAASPAAAPAHLLSVRTWVQLGTGTATPGYSRAVTPPWWGARAGKGKTPQQTLGVLLSAQQDSAELLWWWTQHPNPHVVPALHLSVGPGMSTDSHNRASRGSFCLICPHLGVTCNLLAANILKNLLKPPHFLFSLKVFS